MFTSLARSSLASDTNISVGGRSALKQNNSIKITQGNMIKRKGSLQKAHSHFSWNPQNTVNPSILGNPKYAPH